jgi:hypothetical protein
MTKTAPTNGARGPRTGSNSEVARQWAAGRRDGMTANSMSYTGGTLYSYAMPIARRVVNDRGDVGFFLTSYGPSMTTKTKHMPPMRRAAADAGGPMFYVDRVLADTREEHTCNACAMENDIHAEIKKAFRSRVYGPERAERVELYVRDLLRYAVFVGLGYPDPETPLPILWDWFEECGGREAMAQDGRKLFESLAAVA